MFAVHEAPGVSPAQERNQFGASFPLLSARVRQPLSQAPNFLRPCPGVSSQLRLHSAGPVKPPAGNWLMSGKLPFRVDAAQLHNQTLGAQMRNHRLELYPEP